MHLHPLCKWVNWGSEIWGMSVVQIPLSLVPEPMFFLLCPASSWPQDCLCFPVSAEQPLWLGTPQSCKWGVWIWWDLEGSFLALHSVLLRKHMFHFLKWGSHWSGQLGREICLLENIFSRMQDPSGPGGICVSPDASVPASSIGGLNWGRGLGLVNAVLLGDKMKTLTTPGPQRTPGALSSSLSYWHKYRGGLQVGEEAL